MKIIVFIILFIPVNFFAQIEEKGYTYAYDISTEIISTQNFTPIQNYKFKTGGIITYNGITFSPDSVWILNIYEGDIVKITNYQDDYGTAPDYNDPFTIYYGNVDTASFTYVNGGGGGPDFLIIKEFSDSACLSVLTDNSNYSILIKIVMNKKAIEVESETLFSSTNFISQLPTDNNVSIYTGIDQEVKVQLYSITGQAIAEWLVNNKAVIDMSSYPDLMYFFKAIINNKTITGKYIKF